jgi:hypothetical protein
MRYVIGVLGVVLIMLIAVVMLTNTITRGPRGQEGPRAVDLTEYVDKDSRVIYEVQGRIIAPEDYRVIRITVTPTERKLEIFSGYDGRVEQTHRFANTSRSYDTFLYALSGAGFSRQRPAAQENEKGMCPQGRRFIYELKENNDQALRTWSTSCSRTDGSFGGDGRMVKRLFEGQIPDYRDAVRGIRL